MKTLAFFLALLFLLVEARAQTAGGNYVLLPENLAYFTATREKGLVNLRWQTLNEQNSKGFKVLRKTDGGWETVGFVSSNAPNGSSSAKVSYHYTDANPFKGVSQYQLMETTNDQKHKASEVKAVKGESQSGRLTIYPNPSADGRVNLVFDDAAARDVVVSNAAGSMIKQFANATDTNLTIENLQPGLYFIRIFERTTTEFFTEKVVVNK